MGSKRKQAFRQEALAYVKQGDLYEFARCEAGQTCSRKPVRGHVVSRVQLTHITDNGHGIRIQGRPSLRRKGELWNDYRRRILQFNAVGINNLLVFRGICGRHDAELFRCLDGGFEPGNPEHALLQAYRTALYQDYVYWREAERMNRLRVQRGQQRLEGGEPGSTLRQLEQRVFIPAGIARIHRGQMSSWIKNGLYNKVAYRQVCLDHSGPAVAGAGVMRVFAQQFPNMDSMNLTVIPLGPKRTIVNIVMPKRSELLLDRMSEPLLEGSSSEQKQYLSNLMLKSFPDFVIAPNQWNKQDDLWKDAVWRIRVAHITGRYSEYPDRDINFFI